MDHTAASNDLQDYQWRNRLLLLFAPDRHHPTFVEQAALLEAYDPDLSERDLLVFELFADAGRAAGQELNGHLVARLREHYGVAAEAFVLLLVGKDGTVKRRETAAVAATELFRQIDSMPMRIRERRAG